MTDCLEKPTPYLSADDTEISSSSDNFDTLIENLNCDLNNIRKWLSKNKLKHHPTKSKVMFVGSSRNLNKKVKDNCVLLNNAPIPRADAFTSLVVDLDEKLSWEKHIEKICGKVSVEIGAVRRIKPFVPPVNLQTIYKTLVQPYFDSYCSPLWDNCGKVLQDKLQKFQNRTARIIIGASYDVRSADVLDTLRWETLDARRSRNKSILMYKILNQGRRKWGGGRPPSPKLFERGGNTFRPPKKYLCNNFTEYSVKVVVEAFVKVIARQRHLLW